MAETVLDLRSLSTLCGDYSVHILEKLEELGSGERLKVIVPLEQRELLRESVSMIEASGAARVAGEGVEDDSYYVVLEVAG